MPRRASFRPERAPLPRSAPGPSPAASPPCSAPPTLSKVKKKIRNHEDILGRSTDFQIVPVDESYPVYLREHLEEYQYLMYPEKKYFFDRILGR